MRTPAKPFAVVAITRDGYFIPFGPTFDSADAAWAWLHFEACAGPIPEHRELDVFQVV